MDIYIAYFVVVANFYLHLKSKSCTSIQKRQNLFAKKQIICSFCFLLLSSKAKLTYKYSVKYEKKLGKRREFIKKHQSVNHQDTY